MEYEDQWCLRLFLLELKETQGKVVEGLWYIHKEQLQVSEMKKSNLMHVMNQEKNVKSIDVQELKES